MSLNPTDPTRAISGRAVRAAVVGAAVVALLFAVAMVMRSNGGPDRNRVETAAADDRATPTKSATRRPGRPTTPTAPAVQDPVTTEPTVAASPTSTVPDRSASTPEAGRAAPAVGPTSAGSSPERAAAPAQPNIQPGQTSSTPQTPSISLTPPGPTTQTPTSTTTTSTTPEIETTATVTPAGENPTGGGTSVEISTPGPTLEQAACNNLGLVAIGDATPGDVASEAAWTRFRSAQPQIPDTDDLVCGNPVARHLDDLLIQQLVVATKPHGVLVGGTDPAHPVLWLSEVEWTSYQWRDPLDTNHNFTGMPVGRVTIGGHEMIRTTRGAIVMVRSDSWGYTVLGGAWELWMARGGPAGPMGLPEAKATGTMDATGRIVIASHQDFTHGVLTLPDVTTMLAAEVMPASRYAWVPLTAEEQAEPTPTSNSIQNVNGVSYYVDRSGVRHWIVTPSDWNCAYWDLGARETLNVRGWQVAKAPLGSAFICPSRS